MKKKLSKAKYIEFMSKLTGHTKSFIQKNMEVDEFTDIFTFKAGTLEYHTWLLDRRIYTQYYLDRICEGSWYHDFNSLEYDWKYTEEQRDDERKEMIEEVIENFKLTNKL